MSTVWQDVKLEKLTSTRLIRLLPGESEDEIRCELFAIDLDDLGEQDVYEAISYTWGDENVTSTILCSGHPLQITTNLADALRHFRRNDQSRSLWADAISIDQETMPEKNHQVTLIGKIFKSASTVLAWLGEDDDNTDEIITCLQQLVDLYTESKITELNLVQSREANLPVFEEIMSRQICPNLDALDRVKEFLLHPWFGRAWVYQESYVAQRLIFHRGQLEVEGKYLVFADLVAIQLSNGFRRDKYVLCGVATRSLLYSSYMKHQISHRFSLRQTLRARMGSCCKLAIDIVYSLLAIMPDLAGIVPNYNASVAEVYGAAVASIIESEQKLNVLADVGASLPSDVHNLPSWTPDWSAPIIQDSETPFVGNAELFKCAGDTKPLFSISPNKMTLTVRGARFDTIGALNGHDEDLHLVAVLLAELEKNSEPLSSAGNIAIVNTLRQLSGDIFTTSIHAEPVSRWNDSSIEFFEQVIKDMRGGDGRKAVECVASIYLHNEYRLFMKTGSFKYGLVPRTAEPGDIIVMLLGCDQPVVLRSNEHSTYQLIGMCFVDGVMDGELLTMVEDGAEIQQWSFSDFSAEVREERPPLALKMQDFVIV